MRPKWLLRQWFGVLIGLAAVSIPRVGSANPAMVGAIRAGVSADPDQLLVGGSLIFPGVGAPPLGIDANALLGVGDHLTTVRLSGNVFYLFPVGGQGIQLFPLAGLTFQYYSADCPDVPGFGKPDCDGTELGVNLGGGIDYRRFRGELWLGIGDVTEITLTGAYLF